MAIPEPLMPDLALHIMTHAAPATTGRPAADSLPRHGYDHRIVPHDGPLSGTSAKSWSRWYSTHTFGSR